MGQHTLKFSDPVYSCNKNRYTEEKETVIFSGMTRRASTRVKPKGTQERRLSLRRNHDKDDDDDDISDHIMVDVETAQVSESVLQGSYGFWNPLII